MLMNCYPTTERAPGPRRGSRTSRRNEDAHGELDLEQGDDDVLLVDGFGIGRLL